MYVNKKVVLVDSRWSVQFFRFKLDLLVYFVAVKHDKFLFPIHDRVCSLQHACGIVNHVIFDQFLSDL